MPSRSAERQLPAEVDFAADPAASPARMNRAMLFLIAWLRRLESVQPDFLAATEQLRRIGLERLDAVLSPIFVDAQAIAAALATIEAQWLTGAPLQQLLADLEARALARLTEADQKLVAIQQLIAGIGVGTTVQAHSTQLDALALIAATDYGRSLLATVDSGALRGRLRIGSAGSLATSTADGYRTAAAQALTGAIVWEAAQTVDLVDAPTIAVDCSSLLNARVVLRGNRVLGAPVNGKPHQFGTLELYQDEVGSRTLAFHATWGLGATVPSLSSPPGSRDVLRWEVLSDGRFDSYLSKAR